MILQMSTRTLAGSERVVCPTMNCRGLCWSVRAKLAQSAATSVALRRPEEFFSALKATNGLQFYAVPGSFRNVKKRMLLRTWLVER